MLRVRQLETLSMDTGKINAKCQRERGRVMIQ
jgi:hypothetical protein